MRNAVLEGAVFRDEDWYAAEVTERVFRDCTFHDVD